MSRIITNMSSSDLTTLVDKLSPDTLLAFYKSTRDVLDRLPKESVKLVLKQDFHDISLTNLARERLSDLGFSERDLSIHWSCWRYDYRFIKVLGDLEERFCTGELNIETIELAIGQYIDIVEVDSVEYAYPVWG